MISAVPKMHLPTGTRICNEASIVFDVNPPIETGEACNRIDRTSPETRATVLPLRSSLPIAIVSWDGSDAESGIDAVDLHVSEDGEPFELLEENVTGSIEFRGRFGVRYAFASVAVDRVGNRESPPDAADATILTELSIGSLIDVIDRYRSSGDIDTVKTAAMLVKQLQKIDSLIATGKVSKGQAKLAAFAAKLEARKLVKAVSPEGRATLIDWAKQLIEQLQSASALGLETGARS